MRRQFFFSLLLAVFGAAASSQPEQDFSRLEILREPGQPRWLTMYSQLVKWPTHVYPWWFNPAQAPADLDVNDVLLAMKTAAARWTQMCNIEFQYMGITNVPPDARLGYLPDGINVWGFSSAYPLAGFASTAVNTHGAITDADILLSAALSWDLEQIKSIMTHEIGHALGLGHSDAPSSIMFAMPYHPFDYTSILRGDDAIGCAALYGESVHAMANRTMNWAEVTYPSILIAHTEPTPYADSIKATPAETVQGHGFIFRYYAHANSYLAVKDGVLYFLGQDNVLHNVGELADLHYIVTASGF